MMRRVMRLAVTCAMVLAVVAVAGAQTPTPVVRIGDWVEIGNEAFMNIIATVDIRYRTVHNYDFENRVQDRASSRDNLNTQLHDQVFDGVREESRIGVDMRYQKSLTMRVLFEHQSVMDGNLIDNRREVVGTGTTNDTGGGFLAADSNTVNLERYWLEYAWPGTPVRLFVGAEIWNGDLAGLIYDDVPRITAYFDLGPKKEWELGVTAAIQRESSRIGRVNDNDLVYYVFQGLYKGIPKHRFGLSVVYFRDRFTGAAQIGQAAGPPTPQRQEDGELGQKHDTVLLMPGWDGTIGPFYGLLQFNIVLGTAEATNVASAACPTGTCANRDMDVFAWGVVAYAEVKLAGGLLAPFVGVVYGSPDDDANDDKLEGFAAYPIEQSGGVATGRLAHMDPAIGFNDRDVESPARSRAPGVGGSQFAHSNDQQWNNLLGSGLTPGIVSTYSNPGTLLPFVGVKVFPVKGHEIVGAYVYRAMVDSALLEIPGSITAAGTSISTSLYHNLFASWVWTVNRHFDIRLTGNVVLPADGVKDIARTVTTGGCTAAAPCQGDDPVLQAEARFRARF